MLVWQLTVPPLFRVGYLTLVPLWHRPKCISSTKYWNKSGLLVPSFGTLRLITWRRPDTVAGDWLWHYTWLRHARKIVVELSCGYVHIYGYTHRRGSRFRNIIETCHCVCLETSKNAESEVKCVAPFQSGWCQLCAMQYIVNHSCFSCWACECQGLKIRFLPYLL